MKSKIKRLEKRWGNVGERMREDALNFHNTFTELVKKKHFKKFLGVFSCFHLIRMNTKAQLLHVQVTIWYE